MRKVRGLMIKSIVISDKGEVRVFCEHGIVNFHVKLENDQLIEFDQMIVKWVGPTSYSYFGDFWKDIKNFWSPKENESTRRIKDGSINY